MTNKININNKNSYSISHSVTFNQNKDVELVEIYVRLLEVINYTLIETNKINKTSLFDFSSSFKILKAQTITVNFTIDNYYPSFELTNNELAYKLFENSNFSNTKFINLISEDLELKKVFRRTFKNALTSLLNEYNDEQVNVENWCLQQIITDVNYFNSKVLSNETKKILQQLIDSKTNDVLNWMLNTFEVFSKQIVDSKTVLVRSKDNAKFDINFQTCQKENKNLEFKYNLTFVDSDVNLITKPIKFVQSFSRTYFKMDTLSNDVENTLFLNYFSWLYKMKCTSILRVKEKIIYSPTTYTKFDNLIVVINVVTQENYKKYFELVPQIFTNITIDEHKMYLQKYQKNTQTYLEELKQNQDHLKIKQICKDKTIEQYLQTLNNLSVENLPTCQLIKQLFLKGEK